jgi:hypothetical protein
MKFHNIRKENINNQHSNCVKQTTMHLNKSKKRNMEGDLILLKFM